MRTAQIPQLCEGTMNEAIGWLIDNKEWIFQGLGVFILGLLVAIFRRKRRSEGGDRIVTHGDFSPGKVEGDYEVEVDE